MQTFWEAALGVAGLAGVASFVLWSLYKNWLQLDIFQRMTKRQQFILFLTFFILTFLFAMAALGAWVVIKINDDPVNPPASNVPKLEKVLTVTIEDVDLFTPSKKPFAPQAYSEFKGDDEAAIVNEAAVWIVKSLDTMFPRTESSLNATVVLDLDAKTLDVIPEDEDKVRREHFWAFEQSVAEATATGAKLHPTLEMAPTSIREAIENERELMMHIDRAGYELAFEKFTDSDYSVGPRIERPVTLKKRNDTELVVMFDEVEGSENVGQSLRGRLAELNSKVRFGTPKAYKDYKEEYDKRSAATNRSFGGRETTLLETRVDALVTITFSEQSIAAE